MEHIMTRTDDLATERVRWLRANRGKLAEIARKVGCSHGKVRDVFFGFVQTVDPHVVKYLAQAGAPGFQADRAA
jgi:hypothetical protein